MASCVPGTREEGSRSTPMRGDASPAGAADEFAQAGKANRMRPARASCLVGKVIMVVRFLAAAARKGGQAQPLSGSEGDEKETRLRFASVRAAPSPRASRATGLP